MKLSKTIFKTSKEYPKDEVSVSSQLLIKAGYIDKLSAGVYSLLPMGLKTVGKIISIIRNEMNYLGADEILMPGLVPKEKWEQTGRWESFDALFKLKGVDDKEYALGATHEEVVVPLAKRFAFSYKDFPFAIFQIQNKFRNETRAKSGVLRTREFLMKDLYSFHTTEKDLDSYYDKVADSYWKILEQCGIKDQTFYTFASGGSFSKYSHEFQTMTEAGEDEIYVCKKCKTGLNKEVLEREYQCPACKETEYEMVKAVEVGNIFKLNTKYSEPFDLKYIDAKGQSNEVLMGCYGIGIQRLMGTIAEVNRDEKGLVWPENISPYNAYLIVLDGLDEKGEEIYQELMGAGVDVLYDDRDLSAGEKFADCDLIGIPNRLVISKKTEGKIELKKRSETEIKLIEQDKLKEIF